MFCHWRYVLDGLFGDVKGLFTIANVDLPTRVDETGKTYRAHVALLGGKVDPVSESIKVTANLDGDVRDLVPGMSGRVLIAPP